MNIFNKLDMVIGIYPNKSNVEYMSDLKIV